MTEPGHGVPGESAATDGGPVAPRLGPSASGPARGPSWRRHVAEVLLLVVPLALVGGAWLWTRPVVPAGLASAAEAVRSALGRWDLILVQGVPPQDAAATLRGLPFLMAGSPSAVPVRPFRRVWRIWPAGARPPSSRNLGPPLHTTIHGDFRVSLHPIVDPRSTFFAQARRARVSFVRRGLPELTCPWQARGFTRCPGMPSWLSVRPGVYRSAGRAEACIAAHPHPAGVLRIRFPRGGVGNAIGLRTALLATAGKATPVRVEVRVDETPVGRFVHRASPGWENHRVDTRQRAGAGRVVELRLRVDGPGKHHFCFSGAAAPYPSQP